VKQLPFRALGSLWLLVLALLLVSGGVYFFWSGSARQTAQAVDNVADEVTGNRAVQQRGELKKQLEKIHERRLKQLQEIQKR